MTRPAAVTGSGLQANAATVHPAMLAASTPQPTPHRRSAGSARRGRRRRGQWAGAVFVSPQLAALTLFMLVPTGYAIYTSLFTSRLVGGTRYSGFANYDTVLHSSQFWDGVRRVLLFGVIQVPVTLVIAFFFAAIFEAGLVRFDRFFRTVFFMPFAVPGVVASVMWSFLLLPGFGPYAAAASHLGLGRPDFFSSRLIVPTIIVIVVWEWTGYNMTILYTSLRAVPRDVVEAAIIDGASFTRVVLGVKLPMVRPSLVMLVFLNTVGALQLFTEPSILSAFQPQAVSFGFTPTLFVYNTAVGSGEYNLGAAAAVILAVIIGLISVAALGLRRRRGEFA